MGHVSLMSYYGIHVSHPTGPVPVTGPKPNPMPLKFLILVKFQADLLIHTGCLSLSLIQSLSHTHTQLV